MATRTVQTTDDIEYALAFLAKQNGKTSEDLFSEKVNAVLKETLIEADDKRFALVMKLTEEKDKGAAIAKLRELLGA